MVGIPGVQITKQNKIHGGTVGLDCFIEIFALEYSNVERRIVRHIVVCQALAKVGQILPNLNRLSAMCDIIADLAQVSFQRKAAGTAGRLNHATRGGKAYYTASTYTKD